MQSNRVGCDSRPTILMSRNPTQVVSCQIWTRSVETVRNGTVERITVDLAKDWLSVADICEYMDVSTFVVTSQLRSGALPAVKFGREWRVSRQDFEDWINAQRMEEAPAHDAEQPT